MWYVGMVFLWEVLSDLVRVEQGWWSKNGNGIWQWVPMVDRLSKGMKLREDNGLMSVCDKIMAELNIDAAREHIQLKYHMPEWMDVDRSVRPVPINIRSDDDLDMFLFMRADLHDLKPVVEDPEEDCIC